MKAILVIDMPEACADGCPVMCKMRGINHRPTWCPLKPLPQKLDEMSNIDSALFCQNMKGDQFCIGWNDCLKEITGETE